MYVHVWWNRVPQIYLTFDYELRPPLSKLVVLRMAGVSTYGGPEYTRPIYMNQKI